MFIAILFTIAKIWKQPVSINRWMDKEIVIHTCTQTMEHYLAITEENPAISDNIDETWGHCVKWNKISSVQSLSRVRLFVTPWTALCQASLSITNSWSWPKLMSIEPVMPSNHLILCRPLLLLPSIFPSIRVFSDESALHMRWPKDWSFSFNISPSNEHPGLISFRMDWLDLLAVKGTLKNLLQHYSLKTSILRCSAFFIVQLSHPYTTTGKTIALTRWTFVDKVMPLRFNKLWGSWHCTGDRDQDHPHRKEMQKSKMAVWWGLTNSCEKKRNEKPRRKGKI